MLKEEVIDIPISAIAAIPKRKTQCCKNCDWMNQNWCPLRWESVEDDEVCSCHTGINPRVQEYLKELGQECEKEMKREEE